MSEKERSFMFLESYRDGIKGMRELGDEEAAIALAWELFRYGVYGKRKDTLKNPIAEAFIRSVLPLIDKSVQNGEERLAQIQANDEFYRRSAELQPEDDGDADWS